MYMYITCVYIYIERDIDVSKGMATSIDMQAPGVPDDDSETPIVFTLQKRNVSFLIYNSII